MPIVSSLVGLASSVCWLMYSLTKKDAPDWNILIPNGLGILLLIFQIGVWIHFYKKKKSGDEKDNLMTGGEESDKL